jgi:hypothetical protein
MLLTVLVLQAVHVVESPQVALPRRQISLIYYLIPQRASLVYIYMDFKRTVLLVYCVGLVCAGMTLTSVCMSCLSACRD